jgi:hypothetical protein
VSAIRVLTVVMAGAGFVLTAGRASAQGPLPGSVPGPVARPQFSPYLNLLRRETPAAINYFGLVRPQLATRAAFQSVQLQLGTIQQQQTAAGTAAADLPVTGQTVVFLNTGGYFLNLGAGAPGTSPGQPAGPSPAARPASRTSIRSR